MTISNSNNRNSYTANGTNTTFAYTFKIFNDTDLAVYVGDILQTAYSVTGAGNASGGNIVFTTAPADQSVVTIIRDEPFTQNIAYVEGDEFPSDAHEQGLDRSVLRDLTLKEQLDRSIKLPAQISEDTTLAVPEANKIIGWNSTADAFVNYDNPATSATAAATSATNAATSATNAAASATAAQNAQTATENLLDQFDDRYLGSKTSDPTLDNDGNALIDGALYFNTTSNVMKIYDLDTTTWLPITLNTDKNVSISSNDTTPSHLEDKLVVGTGLSLSTQNDGGNETRTIDLNIESSGTWTPVFDHITLGTNITINTISRAKYKKIGKLVRINCLLNLGTGSSDEIRMTIPFNAEDLQLLGTCWTVLTDASPYTTQSEVDDVFSVDGIAQTALALGNAIARDGYLYFKDTNYGTIAGSSIDENWLYITATYTTA